MSCCEFSPCFLHLHITRMIFGGWSMNVFLFFICTPFALNSKHTRSSCIYALKAEFLKGKWRSWDRFILFSIGNHPWLVCVVTQGSQLGSCVVDLLLSAPEEASAQQTSHWGAHCGSAWGSGAGCLHWARALEQQEYRVACDRLWVTLKNLFMIPFILIDRQ